MKQEESYHRAVKYIPKQIKSEEYKEKEKVKKLIPYQKFSLYRKMKQHQQVPKVLGNICLCAMYLFLVCRLT